MPANDGNLPATRADVRSLEAKMEGRLQELEKKIEQTMDRRFAEFEERIERKLDQQREQLQEFARDMQTELLRGFQAYANNFDVRVAKLTADMANIDSSTDRRLSTLERRVLEIETRLPPVPPLPPPLHG